MKLDFKNQSPILSLVGEKRLAAADDNSVYRATCSCYCPRQADLMSSTQAPMSDAFAHVCHLHQSHRQLCLEPACH
ncbi:hypothetical protein RRG08_045493 [Elysia crispata]|uniref:Uncharacterized protein n=1 Tax=Elysia crispata TaxID=231223 RepID=A0AAE1DXA3_9GAST|nr:hypothetical protein RRG08_045493 [Elysia crispata]